MAALPKPRATNVAQRSCVAPSAADGLLKFAQNAITTASAIVQRLLAGLLTLQGLLSFLVKDVPYFSESAKAQTTRIRCHGAARELLDRHIGARLLFVVTIRFRLLVAGKCHRHITGCLMEVSVLI